MSVNASESGSRQAVQNHRNLEIFSDVVMAVSAIAIMIFIILPVAHVPIGLLGTYGPLAANAILLIVIIAKAAACKSSTGVGQKKSTACKSSTGVGQKKSTTDSKEWEKKEKARFEGWERISESEQDAIDFGDKLDNIKKKGQAHSLTESEKAELIALLKDVVLDFEKLHPDNPLIVDNRYIIGTSSTENFYVFLHSISFEPIKKVRDALEFYLVQNFKNLEFVFGIGRARGDRYASGQINKRENLGTPNN